MRHFVNCGARGIFGVALAALLGACAAATGTLLVTDAWFDIVLESHSDELRKAVYLAVFAELPLAALCFWIAYRTERFLALIVEQVLHLTSPAERPTEGDLIGEGSIVRFAG